jgi:hypothetical protein
MQEQTAWATKGLFLFHKIQFATTKVSTKILDFLTSSW